MESSILNSQERELYQLQQMQHKAKESCMKSFRLLQSHLQVLSYNDLKINGCLERAFATLFEQDVPDFTAIIGYLNVDQLEKQLDKDEFQEIDLWLPFAIKVKQFRETLLLHMGNVKKSLAERTRHKRHGTKSDEHITSSSSRTYITHAVDADIRLVNDQVPFAEGGRLTRNAEQYQAKSLLKAEHVKSKEMIEKETYNELSRRFLLLEKLVFSLEISIHNKEESFQSNKPCKIQDAPEFCEFFKINDLKAQLQAKTTLICNLKNQIKSVKDASNEAKVKHEIDVLETINIELESSVAKLLTENENMSVENADLKAQIQEKVFANVALKNELRKLKGNSVDTKFPKPTILGKPVLQPPRNQSVVRQPNAFKSERPNFSKPRFASQVDVNNVLSKPVTPYYLPKVREYVLAKPHHVNFTWLHLGIVQRRTVNSRAKVQSPKTRNNTKPVEPKSHTQKPSRQIAIGKRFSPKKSPAVHEKPNTPRSCLRWKPTGRIFKIAGLRWIPTRKMFTDNTTKVDSEPSNGSNDVITNSYECDQTLNVSAAQASLFNDKWSLNTAVQALDLNASLFNDKWRLLTTLQAPFLKRKEKCTLQCALSSEEEKSSCV
ncbi:hypothetical protein Tco_1052461 [Tanacetum coccineum]